VYVPLPLPEEEPAEEELFASQPVEEAAPSMPAMQDDLVDEEPTVASSPPTPARFVFESSKKDGDSLIAKKIWGEAYSRGKTRELRFFTAKWLESRFGKVGKFTWGWGTNSMTFRYPEAHMSSEYGCFDSLDLFWEAFDADESWASGFYSNDAVDDSGRAGFKAFALKECKGNTATKCLWFCPQGFQKVNNI
jgi:hypothetical protein